MRILIIILVLLAIVLVALLIVPRYFADWTILPGDRNGAITKIDTILNEENRTQLIGREIRLKRVRVQAVVADELFLIGPSNTSTILVATPVVGTGIESDININRGQIVTIIGEIGRLPAENEIRRRWNVPSDYLKFL